VKVLVVGLATFSEMAGGSARYLSGMVGALRADGHDVRVVTSASSIDASRYVVPGILGQAGRTMRRLFLFHPRAAAAVVRERPDIVNVHFAFDGLGAVFAARALRIPIVVMFQGPWAREAEATMLRGRWPLSTRIRRLIERRVYRSAARCLVLSTAYRDLLVEDYGVASSRIRVIPAGLDIAPYRPLMDRSVARHRLGLAADGPLIVTVRRLVRRMGLDLLLSAIASLPVERRPLVAIAGTGPESAVLQAQVSTLGLDAWVRFLGHVPDDDLPAFYAAGDLCVVPTRELEGFGFVALESYAAGTPVIATAVGGLIDLVGAFDEGSLVDPAADAIRDGIAAYLAGPPADREACRRYADGFAWAVIAPRVTAVFHEATQP
jgi:glycosyltransferase involved in cell wall biosynthesis